MILSTLLKQFKQSSFKHAECLRALKPVSSTGNLETIQAGYSNFYQKESLQPWIAAQGKGPWIQTHDNQVIYDTGGYGMLGFGHNPDKLMRELSKPQVMANIMTPNISQQVFWEALKPEIPHYKSIICLNSGSEANTLAMRISNIHKKSNPVKVSLRGSFHGRTDKPAQVSGSCRSMYEEHLQDYQQKLPTYFIEPNDINHAKQVFETIHSNKEFPEITLFEPIQGEGNPGVPISREFYAALRELTSSAGGLLLADSVQAGWRCKGELSMTKYPQFKDLPPPDMETFSKAINGGQFPLSVLGLSETLSDNFQRGLYGNTMTGNPRALDVATAVLDEMTPQVRDNIRVQGSILIDKLDRLSKKYDFITHVTGTGLLCALHLDSSQGVLQVEKALRERGLNVIHGGENALRFTPWFHLSGEESDFIVDTLNDYFKEI